MQKGHAAEFVPERGGDLGSLTWRYQQEGTGTAEGQITTPSRNFTRSDIVE